MSEQFQYKEEVRQQIESYIAENDLTHAQAAQRIKLSSATRLAKYLGLKNPENKAESDMPRVEMAIRHFLRHQARRQAMVANLFPTSVSKKVHNTIREARKTGDMCLVHGPAGSGKTCGGELYCREQPNSLMITASKDMRDERAMRNLVFAELQFDRDTKGHTYNGYSRRWDWIVSVLTGSERVIIVDNAQRLNLGAFEFFADLNDITGTAVAFLGNTEVLQTIRRSDQIRSRFGIVSEVRIKGDEEMIATKLVEQYAPEGNGDLAENVVGLVGDVGHARRAKKHLQLTSAIKEGNSNMSWTEAFRAAGTKLLKPDHLAIKK